MTNCAGHTATAWYALMPDDFTRLLCTLLAATYLLVVMPASRLSVSAVVAAMP